MNVGGKYVHAFRTYLEIQKPACIKDRTFDKTQLRNTLES